jgi:hypothetical protein
VIVLDCDVLVKGHGRCLAIPEEINPQSSCFCTIEYFQTTILNSHLRVPYSDRTNCAIAFAFGTGDYLRRSQRRNRRTRRDESRAPPRIAESIRVYLAVFPHR